MACKCIFLSHIPVVITLMSFNSKVRNSFLRISQQSYCCLPFPGVKKKWAQLVECAAIITLAIMPPLWSLDARFIDAPSGCCDGFIERIYLHVGFMGRALSGDLTDFRGSLKFYTTYLFIISLLWGQILSACQTDSTRLAFPKMSTGSLVLQIQSLQLTDA